MFHSKLIERPIIFVGVGRSGTTIISEIILQHEELAYISNYQEKFPINININKVRPYIDNNMWHLKGQKKQLNKVSIYNKFAFKPSEGYRFWKANTSEDIDFSRGFLLDKIAENNEFLRGIFHKMVKYQKRNRLAFKITGPSRIGFLQSIFPDAIFIEITRQPLANIRSLLKEPFWKSRGFHQLWWTGAYTETELKQAYNLKNNPAALTALQYKKVRESTIIEVNKHKANHFTIAYEDFIKSPKKEIDRILSITELSQNKRIDDYLNQNKIYNRNTDLKSFFSEEEIESINKVLKI